MPLVYDPYTYPVWRFLFIVKFLHTLCSWYFENHDFWNQVSFLLNEVIKVFRSTASL